MRFVDDVDSGFAGQRLSLQRSFDFTNRVDTVVGGGVLLDDLELGDAKLFCDDAGKRSLARTARPGEEDRVWQVAIREHLL